MQGGGGSLMLWGCLWDGGVGSLIRLEGKINADAYIKMIQEHVLLWMQEKFPIGITFLQDNALIHKAKRVLEYFLCNNIQFLDHPPQFPNLNPIENLCAILKRKVWATKPQNVTQL